MAQNGLLETEHAFTRADRYWGTDVGRSTGADGVLRYGDLSQTRFNDSQSHAT